MNGGISREIWRGAKICENILHKKARPGGPASSLIPTNYFEDELLLMAEEAAELMEELAAELTEDEEDMAGL
jgi:hypothetical protein